MGNCGSFDPEDEFSYHPDEWCDQCNCPKPPDSQVCLCVYVLYASAEENIMLATLKTYFLPSTCKYITV